MRRLVGDQALAHPAIPKERVRVEDGGGVLHAAEARGRLQMREPLVGKHADERREVPHDLTGGREWPGEDRALLRRGVDELRDASARGRETARRFTERILYEWRGGDDHQVHGNRMRFAPSRAHTSVGEWRSLDEGAVRDHGALR